MTLLSDIQERLLETKTRLVEIDRAIAANPDSRSLVVLSRSVTDRQRELEEEFLNAAAAVGIDMCSYRVFTDDDDDRPKAQVVGRLIDNFQTVVTTIYSALLDGRPRGGGRLPTAAIEQSAFDLAYTFSGSVGVALTVPNQPDLFDESALGTAISTALEMAQATTPTRLAEFAERLGPAPVRALYRWMRVHQAFEVGADIQWRRATDTRANLFIQVPEVGQLVAALEATSEATVETSTLSVMLVGIDIAQGTFHVRLENEQNINGTINPSLSLAVDPARVPARYTATLTKTTITRYSEDNDRETWTLDELKPV